MSPLDGSRLDVTVTEGERCRRTLAVAVPADIVEEERAAVARKYTLRVKLKGFRKGKVPAGVIEKRFGPVLDEEAVERLVNGASREAVTSRELHPVSEMEVGDIRFARGEPLSFKVSFDVRPNIELGRLGGFRVERPRVDVAKGAADRVLDQLRNEKVVWKTAENGRPEPGDSVTVLMTHLDGQPGTPAAGGRQYDVVLGQGQALPDIEEAVRTLPMGGAGEFDVTFPDDFPDESRRGERQRLRIELVARRVPELPEADDSFARSVGKFEDMAVLRAKIGEDLERDAKSRAEAELHERLIRLVLEANHFEVPDSMVEAYIDAVIGKPEGVDPEELKGVREEVRPASEFAVQRELLADAIVAEHGLRATEDDVDAKVEALANEMDQPPARVYARLQRSGGIRTIERRLTEAKLFDFLRGQSEITRES